MRTAKLTITRSTDTQAGQPQLRRTLGILAGLLLFALTPTSAQFDLPEGVTSKVITYYSEGVPCYGRVFYPKGFDATGSVPGIVLAHGWTGTAASREHALERYAARFAGAGMVAMAIDYRGWGKSGSYVRLAEPVRTDDRLRKSEMTAKVRLKRTRLVPEQQVEDIRNAISYLQGEPGVDPERIGQWGSSYAGGHVIRVAGVDARVKAGVAQVPSIAGNGVPEQALMPNSRLLADMIQRARQGQGGTMQTGFSIQVEVDNETLQASSEYRPFHYVDDIPATAPILFIAAEKDELINNETHAKAASEALAGESDYIVIPEITHFDIYMGEAFEVSSRAAAEWFAKHLLQAGAP
jgi:hypothetical protein